MNLLVLLGLTLLKCLASPSSVLNRCSNTINLKDPNTNEDIINGTFCGPLKSTSALAQLPLIEATNSHPDTTLYTVVITGPSGINFLAVDCPLQGRLVDTQGGIVLKAYTPPPQDGQYSIEIYSQKGSRIHKEPPGDSNMEMLFNQQHPNVHEPQASSIYVMQSHDNSLDQRRSALKRITDSGINHKIQKRNEVHPNATTIHQGPVGQTNATTVHQGPVVQPNATTVHQGPVGQKNATTGHQGPVVQPNAKTKHLGPPGARQHDCPPCKAAPCKQAKCCASGMSTSFLVLFFTVLFRLNIF